MFGIELNCANYPLLVPVPVQTVDATPSGIKLFLKVVFMKPGKRFGLSAEQKLRRVASLEGRTDVA